MYLPRYEEGDGERGRERVASEEQAWAKWQEVGRIVDDLGGMVDARGQWVPSAGSPLAGDDRLSAPYQVSHAVTQCLMAAIDHAQAVRSLVVTHQELHTAAPGSLARGLVENAATAFWILHPASRRERVLHAMQWYAQNARDRDRFQHALGAVVEQQGDPVGRLVALAEAAGESDAQWLRRGYRPSEPVEYAQKHAGARAAMVSWQLGSGFAHGRPWAFLGALEQERLPGVAPGVLDVRVTSNLARALFPVLTGMELIAAVLRLHTQRRRALFG
ncbi:hypothetical protein ACNKF0_10515 [Nocardioides sp. T5]|uniref:hypothetical protein n=1 Tax=Nocardioides sp. T5 TaxID=3400182 RepID=UPI003A83E3F1